MNILSGTWTNSSDVEAPPPSYDQASRTEQRDPPTAPQRPARPGGSRQDGGSDPPSYQAALLLEPPQSTEVQPVNIKIILLILNMFKVRVDLDEGKVIMQVEQSYCKKCL